MEDQIWGENSEYNENIYKDFKDLIIFNDNLKNSHYLKIYKELDDEYHFHGADFDLFGAIYEEFASKAKKRNLVNFILQDTLLVWFQNCYYIMRLILAKFIFVIPPAELEDF